MDSSEHVKERSSSITTPEAHVHGINLSAYAHLDAGDAEEDDEIKIKVNGVSLEEYEKDLSAYSHLDPEKVLTKLGKYGTYQVCSLTKDHPRCLDADLHNDELRLFLLRVRVDGYVVDRH